MSWIQTYTGRAFWPLDPRAEDIDVLDIAHALSNICRFTGHTREFYSVAQHCVFVSQMVPAIDARWALLHDASEAYLCDVARPVKQQIPEYKAHENALMLCVAERFGLPAEMPKSVKNADVRMLATELRALLGPCPQPWASIDGFRPYEIDIAPEPPAVAKQSFLARFRELFPLWGIDQARM